MTRLALRQKSAAALVAIASFGFVIAPVLHAELHLREGARDHRAAVAHLFELAFQGGHGAHYRERLAQAAEEALGHGSDPAHHHHHPARGGKGSHGDGAPEHFALALQSAPPPPPLPPPSRMPGRPIVRPVFTHLLTRYLVPERSQGPPRA